MSLLADFSAEELERMADKMRSDTSGIRGTRDFTSPEELFKKLKMKWNHIGYVYLWQLELL